MPKLKWKNKRVQRIYDNQNQYGVRRIGERDFRRAKFMIRSMASFPTFDAMMLELRKFALHKLEPPLEDCYAVNIGPRNRVVFRRTKRPTEVKVVFIGDYHTRGSRR